MNLQLTTGKSLAGHNLNGEVSILGVPVGQEAEASRQTRRRVHLKLHIVQRPEALEDVLKLGGGDVTINVTKVDLLGNLALSTGGCDGSAWDGRTRNSGRGSRRRGSIGHGRPARGTRNDASTGRHGTTELALQSLGDGATVVLLGLAALHEDGEPLKVWNLGAELEGSGDIGDVGHLDVGAALVPTGALVAEEDDFPHAASLAAEVVLDVALVGLHDQLRYEHGALLLG